MAKKPPALFRRPVKETVFEKQFLKLLQIPADREFLLSCFALRDGFYVFTAEVSGENEKKLKSLAKDIKANRKLPVRALPLLAAAAAGAGAFLFFTVFLNPILENALERGLEAVFEARVNIDRFRFSLIRFVIGIDHITIADRDRPMFNLFEMDRAGITLNPRAVLRGKIYIEEIRADNLRFGTARAVSGALPGRPPRERRESPPAEFPPLIDLANFDAEALIRRELDKLESLRLYDQAAAFYDSTLAAWKTRVENARRQIAEIEGAAQPFLNFNINSIDIRNPASVERALALVNDARHAVDTARESWEMVNAVASGIETSIQEARRLEQNARNAIDADFARLRSYIDLQSGAAYREIVEPLLGDILTGQAWQYIHYGQRALDALDRVRALQARLPRREKPAVPAFSGRTVHFPSREYPFFYLGVLASDFTLDDWHWKFELRDISSAPDITGRPVRLAFSLAEAADPMPAGIPSLRYASVEAAADFRSNATERFNAALRGGNFPVDMADLLSGIGVRGLDGKAGFVLQSSGGADGAFTIAGSVDMHESHVRNAEGTIAEAIAAAVEEVSTLELGLAFTHTASGGGGFTVNTNIGDLILNALRRAAQAYAQKAIAELERALRGYINSWTAGKLKQEDLDALFALARGDRAALGQLRESLEGRIREIENRVRGAADELTGEARERLEEAEAQAQAAVDETRRRAEETRRQAEAEAQERAEEAEAELRRQAQAAEEEARRRAEDAARQAEEEARRRAQDAIRNRLPF